VTEALEHAIRLNRQPARDIEEAALDIRLNAAALAELSSITIM